MCASMGMLKRPDVNRFFCFFFWFYIHKVSWYLVPSHIHSWLNDELWCMQCIQCLLDRWFCLVCLIWKRTTTKPQQQQQQKTHLLLKADKNYFLNVLFLRSSSCFTYLQTLCRSYALKQLQGCVNPFTAMMSVENDQSKLEIWKPYAFLSWISMWKDFHQDTIMKVDLL